MDRWRFNGDIYKFVGNCFGIMVLQEANETGNTKIKEETYEKLMAIQDGKEALKAFEKYAWEQFRIRPDIFMLEIRRLVDSMSDDDWEQIKRAASAEIEEW